MIHVNIVIMQISLPLNPNQPNNSKHVPKYISEMSTIKSNKYLFLNEARNHKFVN